MSVRDAVDTSFVVFQGLKIAFNQKLSDLSSPPMRLVLAK